MYKDSVPCLFSFPLTPFSGVTFFQLLFITTPIFIALHALTNNGWLHIEKGDYCSLQVTNGATVTNLKVIKTSTLGDCASLRFRKRWGENEKDKKSRFQRSIAFSSIDRLLNLCHWCSLSRITNRSGWRKVLT